MSDALYKLYPPHSVFDLLPVHTIVEATTPYGDYRLMWRGYGRFTNLTTGSEWFVDALPDSLTLKIPAFTIEV